MSFAKVHSAQALLLSAHVIDIEVDVARGLHAFSIVGLPGKAVEESRDRVSAAIKNSGFTAPKSTNKKITVSLAPADVKKEGPAFDLPIALAYLRAVEDIHFNPSRKLFLGELSLDGRLRPVRGVLPLAMEARRAGYAEIFVPKENAAEGALIDDISVFGASTLTEIIDHLDESRETHALLEPAPKTCPIPERPQSHVDFGDIRGQEQAKRGLLIAAAGRHNIVLYGPPGTGKTMLARALAGVLPPLSFPESIEVTAIHSVAGTLSEDLITLPPFRSPHHTASYVSLVGGGVIPRPGEITLAHRGVLFLDEFPEFERRTIDALRQPLEERAITVTRAQGSATFPANFILVAAMNPQPGGEAETISPLEQARYERKVSGPIIDRIDMWIEVGKIEHATLSAEPTKESALLEVKVERARARQQERFSGITHVSTNSDMGVRELDALIPIPSNIRQLLNDAAAKLSLSPRAYHRVIKLARTIADLDDSKDIAEAHVLEALQYRPRLKAS
ncbi:magnesium chelatase [Candidatus Kaiserbacteria bacterium CG10_big_fil_rev_8_21_14_0_10_49_17]|uniref:Magnesium chelatase n=1 Tax=Candidatus Kaiserbacteria bacterium CG10_big_fil_rev_8_21_14_0_10_49_17 TaxID=1974609 RepID=A0A2M6WEF2_9BACT|nr:MAG: magnesium chelatase [Candidatus Kaiserbacteria bacterium CG10_big_fil_rev_8_21_14_0_10_49_17]